MTKATAYKYVVVDESSVPLIEGTTMKVVELVLEMLAYGWSPDELQFQHPYLTLGQIHSALAYYWEHQEELDRDIERRLGASSRSAARSGRPGSPGVSGRTGCSRSAVRRLRP